VITLLANKNFHSSTQNMRLMTQKARNQRQIILRLSGSSIDKENGEIIF
jgi:hypothetical protein